MWTQSPIEYLKFRTLGGLIEFMAICFLGLFEIPAGCCFWSMGGEGGEEGEEGESPFFDRFLCLIVSLFKERGRWEL